TRILIIDGRELYRECLANSLNAKQVNWIAVAVSSVAEWLKSGPSEPEPAVILFCAGNDNAIDAQKQLDLLRRAKQRAPVVLVAEERDSEQLVAALNQGVRAYIPTSASLDVVVQALDLVRRGGMFV